MSKFGKLVGAIDEGTSSARFILFKAGTDEIVCYHQMPVTSVYPQEGWVEQNPMLLIDIVTTCINETVKKLEELGGSRKVSKFFKDILNTNNLRLLTKALQNDLRAPPLPIK